MYAGLADIGTCQWPREGVPMYYPACGGTPQDPIFPTITLNDPKPVPAPAPVAQDHPPAAVPPANYVAPETSLLAGPVKVAGYDIPLWGLVAGAAALFFMGKR